MQLRRNARHSGLHFGAERIWLDRWKQRPQSLKTEQEIPSLEILRERWKALHQEPASFISLLADENLQADLTYTDLKGNTHTQPLYRQLQHLVNHSTYHRGQVVTLLRQLGVKAVSTDLIAYYRQKAIRV